MHAIQRRKSSVRHAQDPTLLDRARGARYKKNGRPEGRPHHGLKGLT